MFFFDSFYFFFLLFSFFFCFFLFFFFFFSSRRRHTRYIGDWSSDVCSSDLRHRDLWHLVVMRSFRVWALVAAAMASSACFQMTTVLKVNGDGSGTIVHRMVYANAALAQLRQFAALAGGRGGGASVDPLSEEQARELLVAEPAGTLVRTSSPYVDGPRVTLLEVDLDEVLKDETVLPRLTAAKTEDDMRAVVQNARGLKINLTRDITLEFTPAK